MLETLAMEGTVGPIRIQLAAPWTWVGLLEGAAFVSCYTSRESIMNGVIDSVTCIRKIRTTCVEILYISIHYIMISLQYESSRLDGRSQRQVVLNQHTWTFGAAILEEMIDGVSH